MPLVRRYLTLHRAPAPVPGEEQTPPVEAPVEAPAESPVKPAAEAEPAPTEPPADDRVRRFVASNETVDSYNTVIKADGWDLERYNRNPIVLWGHDGSSMPVGKGRCFIEGSALMIDVEFLPAEVNPLAEQALRIVDMGLMGVSVGFEALQVEYDQARERDGGEDFDDLWQPPLTFLKQRLVEVSVVTIPSNPDALPVGRALARQRVEQRLAKPTAATAPVEPPNTNPTAEQLRALVREIVVAEVRAWKARRRGSLSGA